MKSILNDAHKLTPTIEGACENVIHVCDICASLGSPKSVKRISLSHVNSAFNTEVQNDFSTVLVDSKRFEILNVAHAATKVVERKIAPRRDVKTMMALFQSEWIVDLLTWGPKNIQSKSRIPSLIFL